MSCSHFREGECTIASRLAGMPVTFDTRACLPCSKQPNPRGQNKVTVDIAAHALRKEGRVSDAKQLYGDFHGVKAKPDDEDLAVVPPSNRRGGPGTELKGIIPKFFSKEGCGCENYAELMDRWGIEGCESRREKIANRLVDQAKKHKLTKWLGPSAKLGAAHLVEKSIVRARQAEIARGAKNGAWFVAVTTAPRQGCTLRQCVQSIRRAGWEPTIFAEPGATRSNAKTIRNEKRLGVWHNFLASIRYALEETDAELILTVQDDAGFHPDSRRFTECILWPSPDAGFVSLYTPKHYTLQPRKRTAKRPPGVNRIRTRSLWGACAIVWHRDVLEQFVEHKVTKNWLGATPRSRNRQVYESRRATPEKIANSDTAIGKVMNEMGRTMWFVDPSPVQHVAKYSAIGHGGNTGRRNCLRCAEHEKSLFDQVPSPKNAFEIR